MVVHGVAIIRKSKYVQTAKRKANGLTLATYRWESIERDYMRSSYDSCRDFWQSLNDMELVNDYTPFISGKMKMLEKKKTEKTIKTIENTQLKLTEAAQDKIIGIHGSIIDEIARRLHSSTSAKLSHKEIKMYWEIMRAERGMASEYKDSKSTTFDVKQVDKPSDVAMDKFKKATLPAFEIAVKEETVDAVIVEEQ